jgi:hypothetical protein
MAWDAESAVLDGPASGIELRLDPTAKQFVVRAVDAGTGAPVRPLRAVVWWVEGDVAEQARQFLPAMARRSWQDGVARLGAPDPEGSAEGVVFAVADGRAPLVEKVEWQPGKEVTVTLEPEARIQGRVLDAETGEPLAGVEVTCRRAVAGNRHVREIPLSVVTAADGAFAFAGLGKERWRLVAVRNGGSASVSEDVRVAAGELRADVALRLPAGVTVAGRVTGVEPGWSVRLERAQSAEPPWDFELRGSLDAWNVAGAVPLAADGAFRFPHRKAASELLFLVVPVAPRHGPALRIQAGNVRVGREDADLPVNGGARRPGAIRGKVSLKGAAVPRGRLGVTATMVEADRGPFGNYQEQLLRRHWALVEPDGSFSIPAAPGQHRVCVVDVVTSVTLLRLYDVVEVQAGQPAQVDPAVEIVEAVASVTVAGPGPHRVEHITVEPVLAVPEPGRWEPPWFATGPLGTPGVGLDGTASEVRFFVPPGEVRLRVEPGASRLGRAGVVWGGTPRAEAAFVAETGAVARVALEVAPPADLGKE